MAIGNGPLGRDRPLGVGGGLGTLVHHSVHFRVPDDDCGDQMVHLPNCTGLFAVEEPWRQPEQIGISYSLHFERGALLKQFFLVAKYCN